PNVLYNGNDGGVFRTDNALATPVTWTTLNDGYLTTQFYAIAIDPTTAGNPMIMGGMQDNGTWYIDNPDPFNPWIEAAGGDGGFCAIEPGGANSYISLQNGVMYRLTQTSNGRIDPTGGSGYLFINPFILDPSDPKRMYLAGGSTVWRNSNLAGIPLGSTNTTTTNWKQLSQTGLNGGSITALGASYRQPNVLYYGTSNGRIYRLANAHLDNATVTDAWSGKGLPAAGYVSSIAVDPNNENRAIMAMSNYAIVSIFFTTDGGDTWKDVSGNLEEFRSGSGNGPSVRWVAILPDSTATYYFAGTSTGLYSTRLLADTATVWAQEGPNVIGSHVATMVLARNTDGLVAVGTHGGGTFSASFPNVTPQPPPVIEPPRTFVLSRNYPNPFNAGTSFTVGVPTASRVRVRIVDIAGRTVATPFNRSVTPNTYTVTWDGRTTDGRPAASGIYFYLLDAPNAFAAGKLTLLR
ncbi:MAG: FlgD immunoglobulin-like domain containing protein, partial [Bacteroidota bacterium]